MRWWFPFKLDENPFLYPGWKIWEALFHDCLLENMFWDIMPLLDDDDTEDEDDVVEQVLCFDDEKWKSSGALEDVVGSNEFELDDAKIILWFLMLSPTLLLLLLAWKLLFTGNALTLQEIVWPILLLLLLDVDEILLYEDDRLWETGFAGRGNVEWPPGWIWDGFITDNIFVLKYAL